MSDRTVKRKFNELFNTHKSNKSIRCQPMVWEVQQLAKYGMEGTLINGKGNRGKHSKFLVSEKQTRVEEIGEDDGEDDEHDEDDEEDEYGSTVWSDDKMSKFIYKIFIGTAPLTFLIYLDDEDKYYIYDGTNRATAITKFYENKLRIKHDGEYYYFKDLPSKREEDMFLKAKVEIREYSGCTEAFMSQVAADMNNGTPMTMGELLNLMRKGTTPRCLTFDNLVEDFDFLVKDFGHRSTGIKMAAEIFKHVELKKTTWSDKEGLEKMKAFINANDVVSNQIMLQSIFTDLKKIIQYYKDNDMDKLMFSKPYLPRTKAIFQTLAMLASNYQVNINDSTLFSKIKKLIDDNTVKYASTNGLYKYMLNDLKLT